MSTVKKKKSVFHMVPVNSRQIALVVYDVYSNELFVHYHSGDVRMYPFVSRDEYNTLRDAANRHDELVDMMQGREYEFIRLEAEKEQMYQ
ncbi:hypothetical protein [Ferviditalea candida]|uniref:KTSC domain-containing protein n=1 Tax=Ferviditalea candida TaxID=3108399 RepID=A0ABU5ZIE8_9BACL|nr:hypothetical protein [Paenibacillaceae bacterium T2]